MLKFSNMFKYVNKILKFMGFKLTRLNQPMNYSKYGKYSYILNNGSTSYKSLCKKQESLKVENYKSGLMFIINNVKHYVTTSEEVYILKEIYADDCYMIIGEKKAFNVIDIGMNVGFSALFFAQLPSVNKVFGFEPVTKTFNHALENFSINPQISKNIHPYNFGIGNSDRHENFIYNYNFKGSVGLVDAKFKHQNDSDNELLEVSIKDVNKIISEIITIDAQEKFILKLDCEGAEFEIIESLVNKNNLKKFEIIILEWHIKSPESIISWLVDAGFVIHRHMKKETLGLIYAFKN